MQQMVLEPPAHTGQTKASQRYVAWSFLQSPFTCSVAVAVRAMQGSPGSRRLVAASCLQPPHKLSTTERRPAEG